MVIMRLLGTNAKNIKIIHNKTMRHLALKIAIFSLLLLGGIALPQTAQAASLANWDAGHIISDDIFTNKGSMNPTMIQAFMQSKVPSCDTWGTQPSEYGGGTRAQWATARGYAPPYPCLKDYVEGGKGSAHIIYDIAQEFSINPQVLLVLLQKEQALVTDSWPLPSQYRTATGYACPDSAPCDAQYYGLTNQLRSAARMFRAIMNNSPSWYTPYVLGNNNIRYNPVASCGSSIVNIRNRATQALYNYTPYQPNAGALAAGYGTAQCGAYGNRNFYLFFTDWFGSTVSPPNYSWRVHDQQVTVNGSTQSTSTINLKPGQTATITVNARNNGNQTWTRNSVFLGTSRPNEHESIFRDDSWLGYNRPAALQETSVAPGELGTFTFTITAPNKTMTSKEYFNLVTEGIRWHEDIGMYFTVNVANPAGAYYNTVITDYKLYSDAARTILVSPVTKNAVKGTKLYGTLKFTNTGNNALSNTNTFLATTKPREHVSALQDTSWPSGNRVATISPSTVQPGQSGTINFTFQLPDAVGTYVEYLGMVVEGIDWMDIDKAQFIINTIPPPVNVVPTDGSLSAGQSIRSHDLRHQLIMQSDGNLVLYTEGRPIWANYSTGIAGPRLTMQGDGNLVIYGQNGRSGWATMRVGRGPSTLVLQNDGNLVTYTNNGGIPTWATYTNR